MLSEHSSARDGFLGEEQREEEAHLLPPVERVERASECDADLTIAQHQPTLLRTQLAHLLVHGDKEVTQHIHITLH